MSTKYIKNKSGYCYKIVNNKKTRISETEYKEKKKRSKIQGGQPSDKDIELIREYYTEYHNNIDKHYGDDDITYIMRELEYKHRKTYTYKEIRDIVKKIEKK
jgi:hypothetical protein